MQRLIAALPVRQRLVPWHGPVEGIFFHPLVLQPKLAFTTDPLGLGFQHFFVTAYEFRRILRGLWQQGWTLVDAHRAATGRVLVPPGRRPLVLSEDDVNYYGYFRGRGLASRLVLDRHGDVRAEVHQNGRDHLTRNDVVPLVDAFVARHPEFSAQGAKGVLAETAYEGFFGEHHLKRPAPRARIRALVARLRVTGWSIASHTYGHIDLSRDSLITIARDTDRWKQLARPLLGHTDMLIYPFGARPTDAGVALLRRAGFRIQFDIDVIPRRIVRDGVVVMSRLHIDGYAFDDPQRMAPLFSVRRVRDPGRPPSS
ncbi:MAG TPA: polysaccharide deacetylase family protein [Mycobacteriales bacterium]|nr:polysaccharide deacetylase family protein [Mycobacteriales bacterium]